MSKDLTCRLWLSSLILLTGGLLPGIAAAPALLQPVWTLKHAEDKIVVTHNEFVQRPELGTFPVPSVPVFIMQSPSAYFASLVIQPVAETGELEPLDHKAAASRGLGISGDLRHKLEGPVSPRLAQSLALSALDERLLAYAVSPDNSVWLLSTATAACLVPTASEDRPVQLENPVIEAVYAGSADHVAVTEVNPENQRQRLALLDYNGRYVRMGEWRTGRYSDLHVTPDGAAIYAVFRQASQFEGPLIRLGPLGEDRLQITGHAQKNLHFSGDCSHVLALLRPSCVEYYSLSPNDDPERLWTVSPGAENWIATASVSELGQYVAYALEPREGGCGQVHVLSLDGRHIYDIVLDGLSHGVQFEGLRLFVGYERSFSFAGGFGKQTSRIDLYVW